MRKRTKRKHWGYVNPLAHALSGAIKVKHAPNMVTYMTVTHGSMTALVRGEATKQDVSNIINANNIVAALMKQGFGEPHEDDLRLSTQALEAIAQRAKDKGRILATGPELSAINFILSVHDAMFETVSVMEYNKAVEYVNGYISSGKSQPLNFGKEVK